MAEKRAEAQALRKAFSIPLPSFEDIGTPEVQVQVVNVETGEITDAPLVPKGEYAKMGDAAPVEPEPPATSKIDMEWLKESLTSLKWERKDVLKYLHDTYEVTGNSVSESVSLLLPQEQMAFAGAVQRRLDAARK